MPALLMYRALNSRDLAVAAGELTTGTVMQEMIPAWLWGDQIKLEY